MVLEEVLCMHQCLVVANFNAIFWVHVIEIDFGI
jgi:hypothetical protein